MKLSNFVTFSFVSVSDICLLTKLKQYFVLGCLCRSEDDELDHYIFNMFDLCENGKIMLVEITMMLNNFPDMGFSNS